ncbi:DUF481 domain-containing protein [Eilatimonas milleporae]|uniref:Putative salt-induced outer membrane protein YdiY n=1 Tax=Eilatimonas milleporae TaxID=911205 RepID=A0A3M0CYK1_9PROT|nr:DUF481 domain-containing protein [Eilatimonas milleporae]RMB12716.1 putative salt-induced outer membrane protein YdiY [Eilatimonas milleporae]
MCSHIFMRVFAVSTLWMFFSAATLPVVNALEAVPYDQTVETVETSLPSGVDRMMRAALASGDPDQFDAVVAAAKAAWPDASDAIADHAAALVAAMARMGDVDELGDPKIATYEMTDPQSLVEPEPVEEPAPAPGLLNFKAWNPELEVGAGTSSGDTNEQALNLGFRMNRLLGKGWEQRFQLTIDFARRADVTTRERFVFDHQTNWRVVPRFFVTNFGQLEVDRFSGFDYRLVETFGVGYDLLAREGHKLTIEAGPGVRFVGLDTDEADPDPDAPGTEFLGRLASNYELTLSEGWTLTNRANAIFGTQNITLENLAALNATVNARLKARLSFQINYDSNAPVGTSATDTATRASIAYSF